MRLRATRDRLKVEHLDHRRLASGAGRPPRTEPGDSIDHPRRDQTGSQGARQDQDPSHDPDADRMEGHCSCSERSAGTVLYDDAVARRTRNSNRSRPGVIPSLHVSPRGEAKCVRGPSGRGASRAEEKGASRLARAGVLEQYVEHGKQAQRSHGGRIACFDRRVVRNTGYSPYASTGVPSQKRSCSVSLRRATYFSTSRNQRSYGGRQQAHGPVRAEHQTFRPECGKHGVEVRDELIFRPSTPVRLGHHA